MIALFFKITSQDSLPPLNSIHQLLKLTSRDLISLHIQIPFYWYLQKKTMLAAKLNSQVLLHHNYFNHLLHYAHFNDTTDGWKLQQQKKEQNWETQSLLYMSGGLTVLEAFHQWIFSLDQVDWTLSKLIVCLLQKTEYA